MARQIAISSQLKDGLNRVLKNPTNNTTQKTVNEPIEGPWTSLVQPNTSESFFNPIQIDGSRWDQLFPYRLIVVSANDNGEYFPVGGPSTSAPDIAELAPERFRIRFSPLESTWVYQLPITPQQLSITNAFAINNSATLRGIVEENSGTKYKMINCSGSFGVWPNRGNVTPPPNQPSSLESLFGGTLQAFDSFNRQISRLRNSVNGKPLVAKPATPDVGRSVGSFSGTGYAAALLLDQFLEQYSELKKRPQNSSWRLAFDMPKQNQTFLVTPIQFTYNQAADSPNEYKFNLQLKAYRRISISKGSRGEGKGLSVPDPLAPNTLRRVLNSVTEARRTLATATNLVRAVRSDVNGPFNALREVSLFVKGLAGLTASVVDLPENIIADAKFAIADSFANLDQANFQALAVKAKLSGDVGKMKDFKREREGQPLPNTAQENPSLVVSSKTSPINSLFDNPNENFELFNSLDTTSVNFPSSVQRAIDNETARVSLLTVDDLQKHKNTLQDLAFQISNAFGTGNETYARVYGKPAPRQRLQPISIDEYIILTRLYDTIQNIGILTINDDVNQNQNAAYEFVKAEAEDAGILFEDSSTKIRVPVPFGLSIEQIAARYLGDQERWLEIATINALKSPYIDEDGFFRSFLSNGDGRQFNVSSSENMFVGQKIVIYSNTQPRQRRTIIDIEKINESNFLITVDGLDNLSIFTLNDGASMQAYLPGTVNSQDQIFIPSNLPVTDSLITRPVPAAQDDALTSLSRIDLLLTEDNDIAINSFGDFRLAYGLTNLFQALRLKFITEPGQVIRHPNFGSGLRQGASLADTTATDIYNTISALIAQDSRYSGIQSLQVDINGPVVSVNLSVFVANGLGVFPISFRLSA